MLRRVYFDRNESLLRVAEATEDGLQVSAFNWDDGLLTPQAAPPTQALLPSAPVDMVWVDSKSLSSPNLTLLALLPSGQISVLSQTGATLLLFETLKLLRFDLKEETDLRFTGIKLLDDSSLVGLLTASSLMILIPSSLVVQMGRNEDLEIVDVKSMVINVEAAMTIKDAVIVHLPTANRPVCLLSSLKSSRDSRSGVFDFAAKTLGLTADRDLIVDPTDCTVPVTSKKDEEARAIRLVDSDDSFLVLVGGSPLMKFGTIVETPNVQSRRKRMGLFTSPSVMESILPLSRARFETRFDLLGEVFGSHTSEECAHNPWQPDLLALRDSLSRVSVIQLSTQRILMWLKGYRQASLLWLRASMQDSPKLLVHNPLRGVIEIWQLDATLLNTIPISKASRVYAMGRECSRFVVVEEADGWRGFEWESN